jgi:hypothetical protein
MRTWVAAVLGGWLVVACFRVGTPFPMDRIQSRIQVGQTTREEIERQFGAPWRTGYEDGDETWTYGRYVYALGAPARTADLKIRFDQRGVVASYTFSSTMPGP